LRAKRDPPLSLAPTPQVTHVEKFAVVSDVICRSLSPAKYKNWVFESQRRSILKRLPSGQIGRQPMHMALPSQHNNYITKSFLSVV
jgi:hypothetical protein